VLANKIVNAKEQRDRQLVRLKVFALAQTLALIPFLFLANGQESPFYVRRGKAALIRRAGDRLALRCQHLANAFVLSKTRQRAV